MVTHSARTNMTILPRNGSQLLPSLHHPIEQGEAMDEETRTSQDHRPSKRPKVGNGDILITAALNEGGIAAMRNGKLEEAEVFFSRALFQADLGCMPSRNLSTTNNRSSANAKFQLNHTSPTHLLQDTSSGHPTQQQVENSAYIPRRFDYDEGMSSFQVALEIKASYDSDYVSGVLLYNLALSKLQKADFFSAELWFGKSLSFFEMSKSKNNLEHLQTLHNLGFCCYCQGKNDDAMRFYSESMTNSWKLVDIEYREKIEAAAFNSLGVITFHSKASSGYDSTVTCLRRSLELFKSRVGKECSEVATVMNNLGRVYYLQGKYEDALDIYAEALRIRELVLGKESIDVAATVFNFAQTKSQLGNYDEALLLFHNFHGFAIDNFGEMSRETAIVHRCIGEIYGEQKKYAEALEAFRKALVAGRASLGKRHPEIASTLNKLGNICYEMQDYELALKYYQDGLIVEQCLLKPCHPHIIITLTNMAHIYKKKGEHSLALSAYRQAYGKQKKTFGGSSNECADTLCSIGLMQYYLKQYRPAFVSYQEALRIRRDIHGGDDHLDIASTMNSVGLVLFKQNLLELSKECFTQSLKIRIKLLGKNHRDVAILWYNIATIHFEQGEEELAVTFYKETLRVERAALGEKHSDVILTVQHIGQVLQQLGRLDESIEYFKEALAIEHRRDVPNENTVARILNLIGNVHLQRDNIADMMDCYIRASRLYEAGNQTRQALVIAGYNFYGIAKKHPECAPVA